MRSLQILLVGLLLWTGNMAKAQFARFPVSGVIEFEKRVNMHSLIKRNMNKDNQTWMNERFEEYKKTKPQFVVSKSTLYFSKDKSLFVPTPASAVEQHFLSWHPLTTQFNTVYNDLSTSTSVIQKNLFEQNYLVKDSTRTIKWKITDETREIAGYSCRRANALVMDSIYVVAYYTDQIPVSSGPEMFSGLQGMILGLALPHEHVTWFATSVADKPLDKPIVPPAKGKVANNKSFVTTVEGLVKQYGSFLKDAAKIYML